MSHNLTEHWDVLNTNYVGFAGFTALVWDHVDTFTMEVDYIWLGDKSLLVYLFLINRYLTPLGFIINLFAYTSPVFKNTAICDHFVRYEGSMTMIGITIVGLMMLIRVYTLYNKVKPVFAGVGILLAVQVAINAWALSKGARVRHDDTDVHACTMIFDAQSPGDKVLTSSTAWLPLVYDTIVFLLTLYRTLPSIRRASLSREIMKRLLADGIIYYGVILAVTLVLTIMMTTAADGLKNIAAQLHLLLTVTMMSRITLNLKKCAREGFARSAKVLDAEFGSRVPRPSTDVYRRSDDSSVDFVPLQPRPAHFRIP